MEKNKLRLINEEFFAEAVPPELMDQLWSDGWRHFGTHFFRYNIGIFKDELRQVVPLRIRLGHSALSKSQRRVLRRNADLEVTIGPVEVDARAEELFHLHKRRFDHGVPDSIFDFISSRPATVPCQANEVRVTDGGRLVAVSYFDIGAEAASGIYAMFDPSMVSRSLGIFTMLKELEYAATNGKQFYYQGYCYEGKSFYDYKKRFHGSEAFDWNGSWTPVNRAGVS